MAAFFRDMVEEMKAMVRARVDDEDKLELNCATDLQVPPLLALHVAMPQRCTHTLGTTHVDVLLLCVSVSCLNLVAVL